MRIDFGFKTLRSTIIAEYLNGSRAVIFTCGNAAAELRNCGVECLEIGSGPNASFTPNRWFTPGQIRQMFPDCFDATSGHLPMWMLIKAARALTCYPDIVALVAAAEMAGEPVDVPSGSGESAIITKMAFPSANVVAVFDNSNRATKYERSPLYYLFPALGITVVCNE